MQILVTGVAGFIGQAAAKALLARGDRVIGVDSFHPYYDPAIKEARVAELARDFGDAFTLQRVDFSEIAALEAALAGAVIDRILHLGAQPGVRYSIDHPHEYARANLVGHLNLLELARTHSAAHMVYASSSSVYGNSAAMPLSVEARVDHPISLYAATKKSDELMSESYAHLYRLPLTGLRFFTVYGPFGRPDMMVWSFTDRILRGLPIPVFGGGELWRDFTYIDDIVAGTIAALDSAPRADGSVKAGGSAAPHAIYNIGNHRSERLLDVIELLEEACGRKAERQMLPMQPGDVTRTFADIDAIGRDLGYRPTTPVSVGIPRFVEWYRGFSGL
jgi:UDP-glucuronate 4-epimerase